MCRYAYSGPYKIHYACFDCRKAFKQPSFEDWIKHQGFGFALTVFWRSSHSASRLKALELQLGVSLSELESRYREIGFNCPECKRPMANLGRDFKAPRMSNARAWKAIRSVYRLGHTFQTCGCNGPGFIPATEHEYREYLRLMRVVYLRHARNYETNSRMSFESRVEAAIYWRSRLAAIETAMNT